MNSYASDQYNDNEPTASKISDPSDSNESKFYDARNDRINDDDNYAAKENEIDSDDDEQQDNQSMLLYEKSTKSTDKSVLLLLQLFLDNKMIKTCLKNTLKVICDLLPTPNNMPRTVFKLFQYVESQAPVRDVIKHFYCKSCHFYYGDKNKSVRECQVCSSTEHNGIFYKLDIIDQLKYLF
ncbi:uncharacterized protein LOC118648338 [Monomorium pharaonis]|uniref:uncharacterized protein LOC118648333 n=1 Tax=Monomorium pharaonis TaxID=307658 RepID=UPI001745F721|nr:uncharacterized protein LOC118648333 [Monomorium pharaonis]XP_036150565.1 uncharacterized protein LOC118648338 [Monomorium pharaonis]